MAIAASRLANRRQRGLLTKTGMVTPLLLGLLSLISLLLLTTVKTGTQMHHKVRLQAAADLTALSLSREQAHRLNALALLNQQIHLANLTARGILARWASLAACAAACTIGTGCPCLAPFLTYNKRAPGLLRRLQQAAQRCAQLQDQIVTRSNLQTRVSAASLRNKNSSGSRMDLHSGGLLVQRQNVRLLTAPAGGSWQMPAELILKDDFDNLQRLRLELQRGGLSDTQLHTRANAKVVRRYKASPPSMRQAVFEGALAKP